MTTITTEKIEELRRLAKAATPGEWKPHAMPTEFQIKDEGGCLLARMSWHSSNRGQYTLWKESQANAQWIAAANPATILALLDLAQRNQTPMDVTVYTLERLRGAMTRFGISCGEGGMEHFSVKFESHLLEFIRAATDSLDKLRQAYADLEASKRALEPQGQALPPEGQEISVDVSTGEHDALHRVFARLTGELGSDGKTWLAEMTEDNASQLALPAGPVPDVEAAKNVVRKRFQAMGIGDGQPGWIEHADSDEEPLRRDAMTWEAEVFFLCQELAAKNSPAVAQPVADEREIEAIAAKVGSPQHVGMDGRFFVTFSAGQLKVFVEKLARAALCPPAEEGGKA